MILPKDGSPSVTNNTGLSLRRLGIVGLLLVVAILLFAAAIEWIPDFGPWLADSVRDLVGPEWVADGETLYYNLRDLFEQERYRDAPPATMWAPEEVAVSPLTVEVEAGFYPQDFEVPGRKVAGDGHWSVWAPEKVPMGLWRTEVHPDPERSQAVVAIVLMDLQRLDLGVVPGKREPLSSAAFSRTGLVPEAQRSALVAAFNGGWQAVHGHYGMMVEGVELLPPVDWACGIVKMKDGSVQIHSWRALKAKVAEMAWFRQTPPCLVDDGKEDSLLEESNRRWGTALGGGVVVRRSAIGIDATGKLLYYAVGEAMTAEAITRALEAAGAVSAAMLDINYNYPRFLVFSPSSPGWVDHLPSKPLPPPDTYLSTPSIKDFFYLLLRP